MTLVDLDRWLAHNLPTSFLKDFYPRAMRRLTEYGLVQGSYVRDTVHDFRMEVDRLDAVNWCIHYFGQWEPTVSAAIQALLPRGGTMVDIGGNVGYSALVGARAVGPTGRVITFEPCARTFAKLRRNIRLNDFSHVTAVNAAIADQDSIADLHCMADNELGQASLAWREGVVRTEKVCVLSAANALADVDPATIDLIKIDVEGAEAAVLSGLAPILSLLKPSCAILLEVNPLYDGATLIADLAGKGFQAKRIPNGYSTLDYRGTKGAVLHRMLAGAGHIQDLVLSRRSETFDAVEAAMHRSRPRPSTRPAFRPSRTPSQSCPQPLALD